MWDRSMFVEMFQAVLHHLEGFLSNKKDDKIFFAKKTQ